MRFAALSTGIGVPTGDFSGRIAAVHSRVCVLALVDESLLTLATPAIGRLPRSIAIDAPPDFDFRHVVEAGATLGLRSGVLRIGGGAFSIDMRPAIPWRSRLGDLRLDGDKDDVMRAMTTTRAALRRDGRSDALVRIAQGRLGSLATATRILDAPAAGDCIAGLIGLGEGATPAGDDFIVGYFAGLWACVWRSAARMSFLAAAGERLRRSASRTSEISRVYLEAAIDGEVSERLASFAACIATGSDDAKIGGATEAALAVGHSSGACGVLGFLEACACWRHAAPAE